MWIAIPNVPGGRQNGFDSVMGTGTGAENVPPWNRPVPVATWRQTAALAWCARKPPAASVTQIVQPSGAPTTGVAMYGHIVTPQIVMPCGCVTWMSKVLPEPTA